MKRGFAMTKKLFITGTGTDIGKTFVSALILKKLNENNKNAAYYKAAMSGNERNKDGALIPGDAVYVKTISGISQPLSQMCPYIYENAVSPHLASKIEGNPVNLDNVIDKFNEICSRYDYVTVEGSGGILCPVRFDSEKIMLEDIIKKLGLSCVIVADAGLGTINAVVLTAEYMKSRNIEVKGVIYNRFQRLKTLACIENNSTNLNIPFELLESLYE